MRVQILLLLAAVLPGLQQGRASGAQELPVEAAPPPPKILLVDLDDVGHASVAAARTPTLDSMRARGRFYTTLVTAPTCSPSRAMFQTGARCSHPDVLLGRVLRTKIQGKKAFSLPHEPLQPLAALVRDAGFTTAKVGKWHLAHPGDLAHPNECGWQTYRGVMANLLIADDTYHSYRQVAAGKETSVEGPYLTTVETDDAIAAVTRGVDLVSLSYHAPHKPWHVPPSTLLKLGVDAEGKPIEIDEGGLTAEEMAHLMLEACDHELGRLLEAADSAGYTVFVFGDNGGQNSRETKGGKGTLYESGVTVPMWVVGPSVMPGEDDSILSMVDFYATVAELFALERKPATQGPHSVTFVPTLQGKPGTRTHAYAEIFTALGEDPRGRISIQWRRSVRGRRFKLFENRGARFQALFDLDADPNEEVNLLEALPLSEDAREANVTLSGLLGRM